MCVCVWDERLKSPTGAPDGKPVYVASMDQFVQHVKVFIADRYIRIYFPAVIARTKLSFYSLVTFFSTLETNCLRLTAKARFEGSLHSILSICIRS